MEEKLEKAKRLKEKWLGMLDEYFETNTFADLEVGDSFICLPQPGDNKGHGGFAKPHRINTKEFAEQWPAAMPVIKVFQ